MAQPTTLSMMHSRPSLNPFERTAGDALGSTEFGCLRLAVNLITCKRLVMPINKTTLTYICLAG